MKVLKIIDSSKYLTSPRALYLVLPVLAREMGEERHDTIEDRVAHALGEQHHAHASRLGGSPVVLVISLV